MCCYRARKQFIAILKYVNLKLALPLSADRGFKAHPTARSLAEFDQRFFAEEEIEYSSFSYRIAAARALSGIIPVSIGPSLQALPSHTEAELVLENLALHLPKQVQSFINRDGSINEILFQTHMVIHA